MSRIWTKLQNLEKGIVEGLDLNKNKRSPGNLTALIGYNNAIFQLNELRRKKPLSFDDKWNFLSPSSSGGGPILEGSEIFYSKNISLNPIEKDHIAIQLIGDTEFHTYRALIEIWKEVQLSRVNETNEASIEISNFYSGFHSPTGRNLIGFHDGVSNIRSKERYNAIAISKTKSLDDRWTMNGTFLSFLRITFDLKEWEALDVERQETIIGRDKETGCPIIGIDKKGKPFKDRRCPVPGTFEVTDRGNEQFREHPRYGSQFLGKALSDEILKDSHISKSKPAGLLLERNHSGKIFRQGFQFVERQDFLQEYNIGLNFVCFQNSIKNLFDILTYKQMNKKSDKPSNTTHNFQDFFSVLCSGNFFVPPISNRESFPGSSMFI